MINLFSNFFFGRKYKDKNQKQKIRFLEKNVILSSIVLIAVFIALLLIISIAYKPLFYIKSYRAPKVTYSDLNKSEINYAKKLMKKIDPIYLRGQEEIIFAKNETGCDGLTHNDCNGVNIMRGAKIYIEYSFDMKEVLCHELLHTYMFPATNFDNDIVHDVVYDAGEKGVCYKDE